MKSDPTKFWLWTYRTAAPLTSARRCANDMLRRRRQRPAVAEPPQISPTPPKAPLESAKAAGEVFEHVALLAPVSPPLDVLAELAGRRSRVSYATAMQMDPEAAGNAHTPAYGRHSMAYQRYSRVSYATAMQLDPEASGVHLGSHAQNLPAPAHDNMSSQPVFSSRTKQSPDATGTGDEEEDDEDEPEAPLGWIGGAIQSTMARMTFFEPPPSTWQSHENAPIEPLELHEAVGARPSDRSWEDEWVQLNIEQAELDGLDEEYHEPSRCVRSARARRAGCHGDGRPRPWRWEAAAMG